MVSKDNARLVISSRHDKEIDRKGKPIQMRIYLIANTIFQRQIAISAIEKTPNHHINKIQHEKLAKLQLKINKTQEKQVVDIKENHKKKEQAERVEWKVLDAFLEANKERVLSVINRESVKAEILEESNEEDMKRAGEYIRNGRLVSFPTETVYGLGANALDEKAVKNIFLTKRRPLSDPVIVHVDKKEEGLQFVDVSPGVEKLYNFLADAFWPGPMTLILRANFNVIPRVVTAQTDFVGIRCPDHEVARRLIRAAQRPIAAPSANLFAHVSPTSAVHVFNDFYDQDIAILNEQSLNSKSSSCQFGIESTVIKIEETQANQLQNKSKEEEEEEEKTIDEKIQQKKYKLSILRYGSLSEESLQGVIKGSEEYRDIVMIEKKMKENKVDEEINQEAPGQLLKHYSPYINCYLFHCGRMEEERVLEKLSEIRLEESVVFDYMNESIILKDKCLKYVSLSEKGDMREIMNTLYDSLRWAENVHSAKNILIYNIDHHFNLLQNSKVEYLETVYDKIFRSTAGKKILFDYTQNTFFLQDLNL